MLAAVTASADGNTSASIQTRCPGGCTVQTRTFYGGGNQCWANEGDTVDCPPPCDGESVYTVSLAGACELDRCDWFAGPIRQFTLGQPLVASSKLHLIDCAGGLRTVLVVR